MPQKFDVIVLGAGPGGYVSAIRAAQLGMSVACIDSWKDNQGGAALGGTCTNVGCIPSKALLQSSENFEQASRHFFEHGIEAENLSLNLGTLIERKNRIVRQNNAGIDYLFRKNKIKFFHGEGQFTCYLGNSWLIRVTGSSSTDLEADHIVIATGSSARQLPNVPFDEKIILSNDGALNISPVPKKLGIIGAGVIGLEMGSVWRRLGAEVSILEISPEFLANLDHQIAKEALKTFKQQGLDIQTGVKINDCRTIDEGVSISYLDCNHIEKNIIVDRLIVSIGRVPYTKGLNADKVGLATDKAGFIIVDENCKTNLPNIWAIGDVVRGPMLAHKAEEEGLAVAERISGQHSHINYNALPWVIYTSPEIAWVGKSEKVLKSQGSPYKVGISPFQANGRARVLGSTNGFVKIISDAYTDEILGVHIIGPMASELITQAVTIMEFRGASEDIARICHAHPTLSEAVREAAMAVDNRAINF